MARGGLNGGSRYKERVEGLERISLRGNGRSESDLLRKGKDT